MNHPLVSVIIPTYNRACFLKRTIKSVLDQDYPAKEVVVVDDGSTDETKHEIAPWARAREVVWVRHESNQGEGAGRNTGASRSRGEYLVFLDSDDYLLPGRLSSHMKIFRDRRDIMWIYSDYLVFTEKGVPLPNFLRPTAHPEGWVFERIVHGGISLPVMAVTIHRKVFEETGGFNPTLYYGADVDFWLKVSVRYPIVYVPRADSVLTEHAERIVNNVPTYKKSLIWAHILNSLALSKELPPEKRMQLRRWAATHSEHIAGICHDEAYRLLLAGKLKESRVPLRLAMFRRPLYWKNYVYYLFSLLPPSVYTAARTLKQRARS
jgi:glycosyltransferase involved in cell wall biosynthesis